VGNQERFDDLTRALATSQLSRWQVLKGLGAGAFLKGYRGMRCTRLSSQFIGRLVIITLASALAAVILGATAFAQGDASQDQYTNEPTQSEPSTAPATDIPAPDTTASSSPDAAQKSSTPDTTASSPPDASQKSPSTATGTTPAQTSGTTTPTAPNASQECPWEPIPPGAYPGGPSGCPWWRGMPGGSKELGNGQCYDTHLGVTYSCSGASQPQNPSQPGQPQDPPQKQSGGKDPSVRLGPGPGSSQDPRGPPKTIGDIVRDVRDAYLNLWIPAFVESSKGYVKARDETVPLELQCLSDVTEDSLGWYFVGLVGSGGKEWLPAQSCLEATFDVRRWKTRFTQFKSYTKCLKANGPFTCLWIEADKSRHH
jgi:hypothetical protein